ncbi:MAG TPA: hypothetical protein VF669_19975 [Tepidisphaeraceae bacterium]|jgi:hypothetical protein
MLLFPVKFTKRRPRIAAPAAPAPAPVDAVVTSVLASFGTEYAIFIFDQPLVLDAGVSFDMFDLSENTGLLTLTGVAGELLDPQHLKITFDGNIVDAGEGWSWAISPAPEEIRTASGGSVLEGAGPVTF